jgi:hypothetical protein
MTFNKNTYFKDYRKTNLTQFSAAIPNELADKFKFKLARDGRKSFRSWLMQNIIKYINEEEGDENKE